ncbi:MAG: MBL fold metallo-hydrolase [Eubacteriales bacterium]
MEVVSIKTLSMDENIYIVINEKNSKALLIDPGDNSETILKTLNERNVTLDAILLTHGHFDHIGALSKVKKATGAPVYIHKNDADMLSDAIKNLSLICFGYNLTTVQADKLLNGGEVLDLAGLSIKVLNTPGHTPGCVSYIIEDAIFTGDTLFYRNIGNTSFPHSDEGQIRHSVKVVLGGLQKDYIVYPGHGPKTTLKDEKLNNVFFV